MNCLKCGREISEDQVFCMECQLEGQQYPVDSAAAVYIPRQEKSEAPKKAPRRRTIPPEEQIRILRRRLRVQAVALLLFAAIALALAYPALSYFLGSRQRTGQNYSAMPPQQVTPAT